MFKVYVRSLQNQLQKRRKSDVFSILIISFSLFFFFSLYLFCSLLLLFPLFIIQLFFTAFIFSDLYTFYVVAWPARAWGLLVVLFSLLFLLFAFLFYTHFLALFFSHLKQKSSESMLNLSVCGSF